MIEVRRSGPDAFAVTLRDGKGETQHTVTLAEATHKRLGGEIEAERIIEAAFRFLLDREPKESILARFELMVIARYFPEFEGALPRYLAGGQRPAPDR